LLCVFPLAAIAQIQEMEELKARLESEMGEFGDLDQKTIAQKENWVRRI
jgi:hypothetical protein